MHVRVDGWPDQQFALLFVDWLRANPACPARLPRVEATRRGRGPRHRGCVRRCEGAVVPRRLSAGLGVGRFDRLAAVASGGGRCGGRRRGTRLGRCGSVGCGGIGARKAGRPGCPAGRRTAACRTADRPLTWKNLGRDELIGLSDDLVVDQDLAVQIRSVRPLDRDLHAGLLRIVEDRVHLERLAGQHGRLGAVDVLYRPVCRPRPRPATCRRRGLGR